jgi:hypothetical protein
MSYLAPAKRYKALLALGRDEHKRVDGLGAAWLIASAVSGSFLACAAAP